jgi:hypothetical protein
MRKFKGLQSHRLRRSGPQAGVWVVFTVKKTSGPRGTVYIIHGSDKTAVFSTVARTAVKAAGARRGSDVHAGARGDACPRPALATRRGVPRRWLHAGRSGTHMPAGVSCLVWLWTVRVMRLESRIRPT